MTLHTMNMERTQSMAARPVKVMCLPRSESKVPTFRNIPTLTEKDGVREVVEEQGGEIDRPGCRAIDTIP